MDKGKTYAERYNVSTNENGVLDSVSGSLPNLVDLSNAVEDAIHVADSGTKNWYTELQNQLIKDGYAIIKLNDR